MHAFRRKLLLLEDASSSPTPAAARIAMSSVVRRSATGCSNQTPVELQRKSVILPTMTRNGLTMRSVFAVSAMAVVLLALSHDAPPGSRADKASFVGRNPNGYDFGLIGQRYDGTRLQEEREAGIETKVFELSWREYYPSEGEKDTAYVQRKKAQMQRLREAGFKVILSLGYHDTPPWVHRNYPNSYYVNQFGERWTGDTFIVGNEVVLDTTGVVEGTPSDNGDANLVFNHRLRGLVASYMKDVLRDFGTDFYGVRLGGGRYGEVTYPPAKFGGNSNLYWAYDRNAQRNAAKAGIRGWRPGEPSPNGEASKFLDWYLGSLVDYQNWQVRRLREAGYAGKIMLLYPGPGLRPGDIKAATASNLDGSTLAEVHGVLQSGHDFAQQVRMIKDDNVLVTTTWLDAPTSGDDDEDPSSWSPVKYLSTLAHSNPARPGLYGENTGAGSPEDMRVAASQMRCYGLVGMAWYDEEQLFSGRFATLNDYERVIESSKWCRA
jgi:hypothetical protein